jgi:hypothetical protein
MSRAEIELSGLGPERLLAVLALFGLMQALTTARPDWRPRVAWQGPPWRPVLDAETDALSEGDVARAALDGLDAWKDAFRFGRFADIKHTAEEYRAWAGPLLRADTAEPAAVAAALASDAMTKRGGTRVQPTPLCAIFGQGHQHFLQRLSQNVDPATSTETEIADAVFHWRYEREGGKARGRYVVKGSLRLDPAEDRRYALAAGDPSAEAVRTVPGANRLAPLGLTLLPVVPDGRRLVATGESRRGPTVRMVWPIWDAWLDLDALCDLLDLPELIAERPPTAELAPRGVAEVYRCERLNVGKFMSFSPARPLWGVRGVGQTGGT